jgi:hypothetical protein
MLALLLAAASIQAGNSLVLLPNRDADIAYDVARPQKPKIRERVLWLAAEHLERVDSSGRATTIFDHEARTITLLTPANRTFRRLDQIAPAVGAAAGRSAWARR